MFHTHLGSLLELKQTGTVVEYTAAFWERLHPVLDLDPSLSIKSFVHQYVEGLQNDIQAAVRSRSPSSITSASSLARIREDEIGKGAAMGADKVGVSDGLNPMENLTDVFPEPAAPMQCRAGHIVTTIDVSCCSALTPTTCSMDCPSSNATVDVFPKLAASAESDENLDTVSIVALAPATYSMGGPTHGRDGDSPAAVSLVLWTMTPSSTDCPHPSPDRSFFASGVSRPLPWPSFPCDGDVKRLTYSWPATQGTLLCLQPKPPWVSYSQALLSKGPRCWEHLYISGNLNLRASCWNFSSPELPLYGNVWFMGYSVTDLVVLKYWDPGGMLQSGSAPLAFPRCFCLSWDPCLTEANHSIEQLKFHKFGSVCKATHTAHTAQPSFEQQKRGKVHGGSHLLERLLGLGTSVIAVEEMGAPRYKEQRRMVCMFSVGRQSSCQTISNSDILSYPSALPEVKNYEELSRHNVDTFVSDWLLHVFCNNSFYPVEKGFRLAVDYVDMINRWYLGCKLHISEATGGGVYNGLNGCRDDALMFCHVLVPADLWCIGYVQTYITKLWRYGKIIGDQAKLSAAHKSARTCMQLAPSGIIRFVSFHHVYWYCTLTDTKRKDMEIAAQYYSSVQYDDQPQDNCCLVKYCKIILINVTNIILADGYGSIWLKSIKISVHLYMHFSTNGCWFRFSTRLKLLYCCWPNVRSHYSLHQPRGHNLSLTEEPQLHMTGYCFSLQTWQRNALSTELSTPVKCKEQHLAMGDLQVKNQLTILIFQQYSLLVELQVPRFVTRKWCACIRRYGSLLGSFKMVVIQGLIQIWHKLWNLSLAFHMDLGNMYRPMIFTYGMVLSICLFITNLSWQPLNQVEITYWEVGYSGVFALAKLFQRRHVLGTDSTDHVTEEALLHVMRECSWTGTSFNISTKDLWELPVHGTVGGWVRQCNKILQIPSWNPSASWNGVWSVTATRRQHKP